MSTSIVLDIEGSTCTDDWQADLPAAFKGEADFSKSGAYEGEGMILWGKIADKSYQTSHEMEIIEKTAHQVVDDLPAPISIIDLGAANSTKMVPYIRAAICQGKNFTYVPLDLDKGALAAQVDRFRNIFPDQAAQVQALWGTFENGDAYYHNIGGSRLFLSLGSIFFNAPDAMADDRCQEFRKHLGANDRLVVGQDSPAESGSTTHSYYQSADYRAFMANYLRIVQQHAGIAGEPTDLWSWTSKMDKSMHYFDLVAKTTFTCKSYDNYVVAAGRRYRLFKSWKRGEEEIHDISTKNGLKITTLGKAKDSGMKQYLLSAPCQ